MIVTNRNRLTKLKQTTINADSISDVTSLPEKANSLIFVVEGTGEFSVRFEHSPDGSNWYAINELDPFSTDASQSLSSFINTFKYFRAKVDIGAGGGSVTDMSIYFSKEA